MARSECHGDKELPVLRPEGPLGVSTGAIAAWPPAGRWALRARRPPRPVARMMKASDSRFSFPVWPSFARTSFQGGTHATATTTTLYSRAGFVFSTHPIFACAGCRSLRNPIGLGAPGPVFQNRNNLRRVCFFGRRDVQGLATRVRGPKPRSGWDRQASGCERSELPVETVVLWIPTAERLNSPRLASLFNRSAVGAGDGPDSTGGSLRDQPEACVLSRSTAGDYRTASATGYGLPALAFFGQPGQRRGRALRATGYRCLTRVCRIAF